MRRRRLAFAAFFGFSGTVHLVAPGVYRGIMPPGLPHPLALIYLSGLAEILGGVGLLIPAIRRIAGVGLILLLLAIFPANVQMLLNWRGRGVTWWAEALLWLRLPLQVIFIGWAWILSRPDIAPKDVS